MENLDDLDRDLAAVAEHTDTERREALHRLEVAEEQLAAALAARDEAAAAARTTGAAWSSIGRLTGLTKQGAQQRWG
jgi:hypothetical protein